LVAAQTQCARAKALVFSLDDASDRGEEWKKVGEVCDGPYEANGTSEDPKFFDVVTRFAAQIPGEPKSDGRQLNEFRQQCRTDIWTYSPDDTTRIDYLALKRILYRVIEEQEARIYTGIPDVTLSSLNLSSSFQIVLEATAGTSHFFRIVPLLAPPTTDIKADHTHTLKITLNGKKNKGDKSLSKKLYESCRERVTANALPSGGEPADFCGTEPGQLLEAIVQALEKGGSSTPAGQ
jgi:hypothetical protein